MSRVVPALQSDLFTPAQEPHRAASAPLTMADARIALDNLIARRRLDTEAPWPTATEAMAEESEVRRLASLAGPDGPRLLSAHESEVARLYGMGA